MKKQAFNPYLPSYEYVPDGEPHVFGDRLYVYGSHDRFGGEKFCMNDYVCWSAPVDDLADWRYEGVIYRKVQDPDNADGGKAVYAPDVAQGPDGRFYLYYGLADDTKIGVAVCDTPAGAYQFLDCVHDKDGKLWGRRSGDFMPFDPGVLVEEDGRIHLYAGQGPMFRFSAKREYARHLRDSAYYVALERDMVTMKMEPKRLLPNVLDSDGTGFEEHEFFEANSIRKFDGKYYFIYSSMQGHELCWAVSDRPDGGFCYGGVLTSNGDLRPEETPRGVVFSPAISKAARNYIGNNHGSVVRLGDDYYVFGHRHTNRIMFSRQGYAERIAFKDGAFGYAELTSCGLNGGPLRGVGVYEARIACHLRSKKGCASSAHPLVQHRGHPAFTQDGADREEAPDQHIENMRDGASALFRYFDFAQERPTQITLSVRGKAEGVMIVCDAETNGQQLACVPVSVSSKSQWQTCAAAFRAPEGVSALCFVYQGRGHVDFMSFTLA